MSIIPWRRTESPVTSELNHDDLRSRFWGNDEGGMMSHLPAFFRSRPFPAVNIAETEDSFCITMDCPGLGENDFEIQAMGKQLIISGERKWEEEKKAKEYSRVESQFGKFERTVQLPENARTEPDEIDARYNKGILTVTVPKLKKTPAAKIPVHTG